MTRDTRTYEVAWIAANLHISPNQVLELDPDMYRAVRAVLRNE